MQPSAAASIASAIADPSPAASPGGPITAMGAQPHVVLGTRLSPEPARLPPPNGPRIGWHDAATAGASEPAPEVHVHIGRVELTAVSEPQASQRTARPARSGRSLAEYLQQRRDRSG
jgi:hypothetical protein